MSKPKAAVIVDGLIVMPRQITEADLLALETARQKVVAMKAELELARVRVETLEGDIMLRLKAKCRVVGRLTAVISREVGARRPPWKDLHLDHMSQAHGFDRGAYEMLTIASYPGQPVDVLIVGTRPGKAH